jgi:hypothetical protein
MLFQHIRRQHMSNFDSMGKKELRAACKDARVKNYGKLTVAAMRAALTALQPTAPMEVAFKVPEKTQAEPELKPVKRSKPKDAAPVVKREVRNGVKRPLDPDSKCGQVWAALDELVAKGEKDLTTAIHAIGDKKGWNKNNTSLELSAYRRFHGLSKDAKAA